MTYRKVVNGDTLFQTSSSTTPSMMGRASETRPILRFGRSLSCAPATSGAEQQASVSDMAVVTFLRIAILMAVIVEASA